MTTPNPLVGPPPYATPVAASSGVMHPRWQQWFTQMYQRIGQGNAPSNTQLQDNVANVDFDQLIGNISVDQMDSGTDASFSTFFRGDGSWKIAPTGNFASSYFDTTATWARSSSSFGDPTNSTSDALHAIHSNGLSLTAPVSSKLGVTFTPASVSAIYWIDVYLNLLGGNSSSAWTAAKLWDGTNLIALGSTNYAAINYAIPLKLSGPYAPGTINPVSVTVQLAASASSVTVEDPSGLATPAMFSVMQIG
jgi:hypothetical protein